MNLKAKTHNFIEECLDFMFPVRLGLKNNDTSNVDLLERKLLYLLDNNFVTNGLNNQEISKKLISSLSLIKIQLEKDIEAIFIGDPAAKSKNEIILAYPGFFAIACYRIGHHLLKDGVSLLPRIITEYAHSSTGIDIHPGATIGEYFCIDHGTGIVIGETTVIGDWVKIYQGVTLGALSIKDRNECPSKRHPTIGNRVVIYAQAIILGGDTKIGNKTIIGGNVWITQSVPANSRVYFDNSNTNSNTF